MKLFYTDVFELPLPDKHRFPMSKYRLLRERIYRELISPGSIADYPLIDFPLELEIPRSASDEELELAHDRDYIASVVEGSLDPKIIKRIGFPWSEKLVERSRRSTGATIDAAISALTTGCSVNLAGGTHHAFTNAGEGYCVFNDSCVAARLLQRDHGVENVLVVDCDVHQGNGTAEIARNDRTIFTFSIHNQKNYPFRKMESDLDIGLVDDLEDDDYLDQLSKALHLIKAKFKPDFVFYVSGADPYRGDKLGRLKLTKQGLKSRDELVLGFFGNQQIPMAVSMAGGYAKEVEDIVDIHFSTVLTAATYSEG